MSEARKSLAPPGGVAQPGDDRGERQDRRTRLQRGPLGPPDRVMGQEAAQQPADRPDAQGLTPVRVAMQYLISDSGLLIADDFGYMREVGIDF